MSKRSATDDTGRENGALLVRFWQSARGFWSGRSRTLSWTLAALLVATVGLQLFIQYRLNYWSRDFFNAIEQKDGDLLWLQLFTFAPLAAASLALALVSLWGRMTAQREWRRWLSNELYDYWVRDGRHAKLHVLNREHQTPEYRIAEDARVATELPVDLALGLLSSVLTAAVFIGVLQSIGESLACSVFGIELIVPSYLVVAVVAYSLVLTSVTIIVGRRLVRVIENLKGAEAELRAAGSRLRSFGEGASARQSPREHRLALRDALDLLIERWRGLCWQLMRMTVASHTNILVGPSIALLLCAPKYIGGTMTLGAMVQAAAAFAVVQGAISWVAESFGRLAEWASSARRVGSLLQSLDRIESPAVEPDHSVIHAQFAAPRRDLAASRLHDGAARARAPLS